MQPTAEEPELVGSSAGRDVDMSADQQGAGGRQQAAEELRKRVQAVTDRWGRNGVRVTASPSFYM